jgi:predicted ATP-grasp superfamily ATP-dependent carboligase
MRVFVYEHLTAQGTGRETESSDHPMYCEGRAMRDAVAEDFRRVAGVEVFVFPDSAAPVDNYTFADAAGTADWSLVIAPEVGGTLASLAEEVWPTSSRFLGPSLPAIKRTTDKLALAEHWYDNDVPTPATWEREPSPREAFPVVWKPQDGAGSHATFRLQSATDLTRARARLEADNHNGPMILQEFVPGRAASVAFLCGPGGNVPLLPAFQLLSDDGRLRFLGGELPIPEDRAARAVKLARRAVDCVPGLLGYVGVDLVLGDAPDGPRDFAIEINPRLTTSYVGLRALALDNLAEAMLKAAKGELRDPLKWKTGRVRFGPDGSVGTL